MRVALLSWDFPPAPTGLGRAAAEIAAGLGEQGADVTVFAADRTGSEETGFGRVIGCAPPTGSPGAWLRRRAAIGHLVGPRAFLRAVRRAHAARPFDVVEATNWYAPAALLTRGPAPLVVRNSTPAIEGFPPLAGPRDRLDQRFAHRLEARTARRAAVLISNTAHHRERIDALYGIPPERPHHVIGLALASELIAEGAAAPPPDPAGPVVFIGRAERRKGFDEAVQGVVLANERRGRSGAAPIALSLVGLEPEDWRHAAARLDLGPDAHAAIRCHGRADDREVRALLASASAVLAPSRYESYGIVYREAAAFGRPLVACAEDPSAREFLGAVPCGALAERCAAAPIADAIERALDQARLPGFAAAGRAHAASLTRARLGEATLRAYGDAAGT